MKNLKLHSSLNNGAVQIKRKPVGNWLAILITRCQAVYRFYRAKKIFFILVNQKSHFGFTRMILYLSSMIQRVLQAEITKLLKSFPAVCILGPRQVGKTTLATTIATTFKNPHSTSILKTL